jgi:hypothetical protein
MILYYKITIKKLSEEGKNFKWGSCDCIKCNRKMWGHGYVTRYFSGIPDSVYLKRYRCPGCRSVVSTRPEGFFAHIRSSIFSIYSALKAKISNGHWPPQFPRQRGGHWLKRFTISARMSCQSDLISFLDRCFEKELHFFT